jgi:hypothetical protein
MLWIEAWRTDGRPRCKTFSGSNAYHTTPDQLGDQRCRELDTIHAAIVWSGQPSLATRCGATIDAAVLGPLVFDGFGIDANQ